MSTENNDQGDTELDQEIELYGPEDGGWYTTRVHDWIGLCEDLRDPDCRGYLILRSLVIEKFKNPVRKLTMRTLCQLIPGQKKGEPSSHSRVRVMLKSLGTVGLVVDPDTGQAIKTSSRASSLDKPLRLRINDMPKPGYRGWRNAEAKLAAITGQAPVAHPEDTASEPGSKSNPAPSEDTQDSDEAGSKSNPEGSAGSKSDPRGSKSNPRGSKSNPDPGADQQERDVPLVLSLGTSLSGAAPEEAEAGEREEAAQKNDNPDHPEAPVQTDDADKVIDAYIAAYMRTAGLPPRPDAIKAVRTDAAALLSVGRSVGNLCTLAGELGAKGWTDLVKHAQMNPEQAARPTAVTRPWCGECNGGREPMSAAERMRENAVGRMEKCHCHPGYVPAQAARV